MLGLYLMTTRKKFQVDLNEVISCDVKFLKENIGVECIFHEGELYGVCRTCDLYLDTKIEKKKERIRLNLTVKKELQGMGGKIVAQSGLAKGPDGTVGFVKGWTKRSSAFEPVCDENIVGNEGEDTVDKMIHAENDVE